MKNAQLKKNQKLDRNGKEAEETNAGSDGQTVEELLQNLNHLRLSIQMERRASRGSATDPQSLYARVFNFFQY